MVMPRARAREPEGTASPASLDFTFAARPIWLLGHLVLVVAVVGFIVAGMWQLERHQDRRRLDTTIAARIVAPAAPLPDLLTTYGADPEALALRRVILEGEYLAASEVIWLARTRSGVSGHDVLTPLATQDGVVIVDRGWVPIDVEGPPVVGAEPPPGTVRVDGVILEGQVRSGLGPVDPDEGTLDRISRVDLERLAQQVPGPLQPFYVQLVDQIPAQEGGTPVPQVEPEAGSGPPHLSYAVQWFVFAAVALVGYPILLWRTARRRAGPPTDHAPAGPGAAREV